jgi:hypothetical protein
VIANNVRQGGLYMPTPLGQGCAKGVPFRVDSPRSITSGVPNLSGRVHART